MSLSTEQILLLNNLTYTYDNPMFSSNMSDYTNLSVADYIAAIESSGYRCENDSSYMTQSDWRNIITAIKNDDTLMNVRIVTTHIDSKPPKGNGYSVIYADNSSKEAVVCFKGTQSDEEWIDNFEGATSTNSTDGVSTQCQENALEWYQESYDRYGLDEYSVTVTGHSKGGNKAKYVTIMDDSVDRCLSFDGQGFSDQFVDKYSDKIAQRKGVIENHNVDNDYVNILLNDVGEQHFYTGQDIGNGEGGFLENHCPNSFFKFENGSASMIESPNGRGEGLEEVDQLLNSILRSLPEEEQANMAQFMNEIRRGAFNGCKPDYFVNLILSEKYAGLVVYLMAYLTEYAGTSEMVDKVLTCIGGEDFKKAANVIVKLIQDEDFTKTIARVSTVGSVIPNSIIDKLLKLVKKHYGDDCEWVNAKNFKKTLAILYMIHAQRDKIKNTPNGKDRVIGSVIKNADFEVNVDSLFNASDRLKGIAEEIARISEDIRSCRFEQTIGVFANIKLNKHCQKLTNIFKSVNSMGSSIKSVGQTYKRIENKITS